MSLTCWCCHSEVCSFVGFPTGPDTVSWNAHRIYGLLRLFLVFQGFEVLDMVGMDHSVADSSTILKQLKQ
jgi:hypothetical protein